LLALTLPCPIFFSIMTVPGTGFFN
jgi:hypothetical protein